MQQRPYQSKNWSYEEIQQPANHRQDNRDRHLLPTRRFDVVLGLRTTALILDVQLRDWRERERDQQQNYEAAYAHVGRGKAAVCIGAACTRKNEVAAHNGTQNPTSSVQGLSDIDARGSCLRRTKDCCVRICDCFQASHARSNYEKTQQEGGVGADLHGRNEPERAGRDQ